MNFDEKAKEWDNDPDRIARTAAFAAEIRKISGGKQFKKALEFGSGTGNVSIQLASLCKEIILADTSAGMIDVLKGKIEAGKIENMKPYLITDSEPLSRLGGFDTIFTLLTMHHVKDISATIGEFGRLLQKGGYLFIGDLVTEDGSFHFRDPEFDGHLGFETGDLKKIMRENGIEYVTENIFYTINREHNSIMKKYPIFILAGRKI
jgi:ubiquinone/menaquinone biosynthesis C-methylase UbiE